MRCATPKDRQHSTQRIGQTALLLVCATVGLIACADMPKGSITPTTTATSAPTKAPPPEGWALRWLSGEPCRPPCWEGVTPGRTRATEAVELLKASPVIARAELTTTALLPDLGFVIWTWIDGAKGGDALYHAQSPTQTVYAIRPYLPIQFKFADVIQAYGEPSHVIATASRGPDINSGISYSLRAIYRPQGFMLILKGAESKPILDKDIVFDQVIFFALDEDAFANIVLDMESHPEWLVAWQGFQDFDYYCRDLSDGILCRGGN